MICTRPDCDRPVRARGLCQRHYQAAWQAGQLANHPRITDNPGAQFHKSAEVKRRRFGKTAPPPGHLWVDCWCGRSVVAVPVEHVGRLTLACHRADCCEDR